MAARSPPRIRCSTCPQTNTKEEERTIEPGKGRERERYAHPLRVYVHTRARYAHARVSRECASRKFDRSVGPFACSSFPDPSRIFPPFGFHLRCGRPITKKFLTSLLFASFRGRESLLEVLIFTPRSSALEFYSRPIKASDSLVGLPPPKLNPFHFN